GGVVFRDAGGGVLGGIGVSGARTEDDIAIGRVAVAALS
ncbi:MAG: heme-binding protein, partial [Gluconacetobacter sp.]